MGVEWLFGPVLRETVVPLSIRDVAYRFLLLHAIAG